MLFDIKMPSEGIGGPFQVGFYGLLMELLLACKPETSSLMTLLSGKKDISVLLC
jgi:hypothetical protein